VNAADVALVCGQSLIDVPCPVCPDMCVKLGSMPPIWRQLPLEHTYLDVFGLAAYLEHATDAYGVLRLGLVVPACDDVPSLTLRSPQTSAAARDVDNLHSLEHSPTRVTAGDLEMTADVAIAPDVVPHLEAVPEIPSRDVALLDKLGEGGFATVYRGAWLHAAVAVKVLTRTKPSAGTSVGASVLAEAKLLATLRHPHIVRVFGVSRVGDVLDFNAIVLDLEGQPLLVWLKGRRAEIASAKDDGAVSAAVLQYHAELCDVLSQVASGLAYCHAQSPAVVHRDVKPANIVVNVTSTSTKSSNRLHARLIDFGTASLKSRDAGGSDVVCVKGTAKYMAPESWGGVEARIHSSADMYSFGVTMIACVLGNVKFAGQPASAGVDVDGQWRWIRSAVLSGTRPELPRALEWERVTETKLSREDCKRAHPEMLALISQCLLPEACERPTALDAATKLSEIASLFRGQSHGK
jgi:serine/threonine protein kinase